MAGVKNLSAVSRAEQAFRRLILTKEDGAFLGSEEQLLVTLGVSRPTFRQVAKLLQRDHLLDIRRGVGGGFYGRRPSIEAVGRAASVYLHAQRTTLRNAMHTVAHLSREMLHQAAACQQPDLRLELSEMLAEDSSREFAAYDMDAYVADEMAFVETLLRMGSNPVNRLLTSILYQFAAPTVARMIMNDAERIRSCVASRVRCAEAVLERDGELASLWYKRRSQEQYEWITSDLGGEALDVPLFSDAAG